MPIIPGVVSSAGGRQPGAPTIGTATAGNGSASVTFTVPAYLGKPNNNNIYIVTAAPGGVNASSITSPISITGLTNGVTYTFTVTANTRNSVGAVISTSLPSSSSNSATPVAPPTPVTPTPTPVTPTPTPVTPVTPIPTPVTPVTPIPTPVTPVTPVTPTPTPVTPVTPTPVTPTPVAGACGVSCGYPTNPTCTPGFIQSRSGSCFTNIFGCVEAVQIWNSDCSTYTDYLGCC